MKITDIFVCETQAALDAAVTYAKNTHKLYGYERVVRDDGIELFVLLFDDGEFSVEPRPTPYVIGKYVDAENTRLFEMRLESESHLKDQLPLIMLGYNPFVEIPITDLLCS